MNIHIKSLLQLSCIVLLECIKATHLLLFARDALNEAFSVELPFEATVQDLHDEIMREQALNTTVCKLVLSFHHQPLNEMEVSLADTGMSMQSVVDFHVVSFIPLPLISHSSTIDSFYHILYWDPTADLTQLEHKYDFGDKLTLHCIDREDAGALQFDLCPSRECDSLSSHSLLVVDADAVETSLKADTLRLNVDALGDDIDAVELRRPKYAHDVLLTAPQHQSLAFSIYEYWCGETATYALPKRYSLLLKHRKDREYAPVIELEYDGGNLAEADRHNLSFDTLDSLTFDTLQQSAVSGSVQHLAVSLYDAHGKRQNTVYQRLYGQDATSHCFHIWPLQDMQHVEAQRFRPETVVTPSDLSFEAEYARDMELIAERGDALFVEVWSDDDHFEFARYRIPGGYAVWLREIYREFVLWLPFHGGNPGALSDRGLHVHVGDDLVAQIADNFIGAIAVALCDDNEHGSCHGLVYLRTLNDRLDSHLCVVERFKEIRTQFAERNATLNIAGGADLEPWRLRQAKYAKDLVLTPKQGQVLRLMYVSLDVGVPAEYSMPAGYGLVLQYNQTQSDGE